MRAFSKHGLLQLLGALCATAGVLAWIDLAWRAFAEVDRVSPQGEEGGRLLVRGLTGTLLMIAGTVLLHVAANAAEEGEPRERTPPR